MVVGRLFGIGRRAGRQKDVGRRHRCATKAKSLGTRLRGISAYRLAEQLQWRSSAEVPFGGVVRGHRIAHQPGDLAGHPVAADAVDDAPEGIVHAERLASEKVRTVEFQDRVVGDDVVPVPPAILPQVTTIGSIASNWRRPSHWSASTISQATGTGSSARCGCEPCPPLTHDTHDAFVGSCPSSAPAARTTPQVHPPTTRGRAYAAITGTPAASSSPPPA